jgi:hypothetical protein
MRARGQLPVVLVGLLLLHGLDNRAQLDRLVVPVTQVQQDPEPLLVALEVLRRAIGQVELVHRVRMDLLVTLVLLDQEQLPALRVAQLLLHGQVKTAPQVIQVRLLLL